MNTPRYEYSRSLIRERIALLNTLNAPFGLKVRYAIKANPYLEIMTMMNQSGMHFDASSSYEASELLQQGIAGDRISLSSQQSPHNLDELLQAGVTFVATSIHQLELYLDSKYKADTVSVRINPDVGYGHNNRTSTGGVSAGFGIWYEYIPQLIHMASSAGVTIDRLHVHIGSGADPSVWAEVMKATLAIVDMLPDVVTLDIGGGYKVHRYGQEPHTDISAVVDVFAEQLSHYKVKTGRKLALEIEPGTYCIANAGTLIAQVDDIVDTGKNGFAFLRLNTGMNDFLRTTMYGAQHRIEVVNDSQEEKDYVIIGHNCESGDILTCAQGDPETIETRRVSKASIGDIVKIHDTGAYCASMRARGYNAFPDALEYMVD